jgi:anti-sigma B factor antagonist
VVADVPSDEESPSLVVSRVDGRLRLVGALDAVTSDDLLAAGREAVAGGSSDLCLDVSDLRFCDSAGLRALVLLSREVDGDLALQDPPDVLVRLLEVTGLTEAFRLT